MTDDPRLLDLGQFTPEGALLPGFGRTYPFFVGRDDVHGILHHLIPQEPMTLLLTMYGMDDEELNNDVCGLMKNRNVRVQVTLDKSQAGGVHERKIVDMDRELGSDFYNSFVIGQSQTHQINHSKSLVLVGLGIAIEGSTNWSNSGEGTGIVLDGTKPQTPGYRAQNNTIVVSTNPVFVARLAARLNTEHVTALLQQVPTIVPEPPVSDDKS